MPSVTKRYESITKQVRAMNDVSQAKTTHVAISFCCNQHQDVDTEWDKFELKRRKMKCLGEALCDASDNDEAGADERTEA